MGLFNRSNDCADSSGERPLYESKQMGLSTKVFKNRVDMKAVGEQESIPLNQIASVKLGAIGKRTVIIETSGGKTYTAFAKDKKAMRQVIVDAIEGSKSQTNTPTLSAASELAKLAALKEQGVLTQEEFNAQKRNLLGT